MILLTNIDYSALEAFGAIGLIVGMFLSFRAGLRINARKFEKLKDKNRL